MDKADDLPLPWTVFPVRSQYSEGSRTYCLWSIFCRSSSKLHRLDLVYGGLFPWHLSKGSWIIESGLWNTMLGKLIVVIYFSIFNIIGSVFLLARMSKEDIALRNQFGKKWDDWAKSVPYSIFPGIY